jgi:hypothetical protein
MTVHRVPLPWQSLTADDGPAERHVWPGVAR